MAIAANNIAERDPYADAYSGEALESCVAALDEREKDLQDSPMPEQEFQKLHEPVSELKDNIREFAEQENIYGPEPETWEHYHARQSAIESSMEAVDKAYHDDAPPGIQQSYLDEAVHNTREANDFWKREFAKLLEKDQRMEQEMTAMRTQMEELQKAAQEKNFTPEQLAQSMALAMTFLENSQMTRTTAHKEKHPATARLFKDARQAVHETYQEIVGAPKRAKAAILNKAFSLADKAVNRIAGVFDKGILFLAKRKQAIAQMSPLYEQKMEAVDLKTPYIVKETPKVTEVFIPDVKEPEREQTPEEELETQKADETVKGKSSQERTQEEQEDALLAEMDTLLQNADDAMKDLDYDKYLDRVDELKEVAFRFSNKEMRNKLPLTERKFLSSFLAREKNFRHAVSVAPNYAKYETLEKQETELKHVAKDCLMDNMLQSDVVDLINKYAPSAGIAKEGQAMSLGEKIVQEAMKDPEVQRATQQEQTNERQR